MPKLKNYNSSPKLFVLFLTFTLLLSCGQKRYHITRIDGREIPVTATHGESESIETFVKPYRDHINNDLSIVLAHAPQTLDKSGKWQSTLGNLFADIAFSRGNPVFRSREGKNIDFVLLNHGGIRAILPQGDVTARNAYQIMPFENSLVVVALNGRQVQEIADYIVKERKAHPVSGFQFDIVENAPKNIRVQGKLLDQNQTYYVGTNDYLANGGDNMTFFAKGTARHDLDYKLRNMLIDYFRQTDTIPVLTDQRIIEK